MEKVEFGICRFNNVSGVTCYMNSILAVIQQTPIFIDYILTFEFKKNLLIKYPNKEQVVETVMFQLYLLMKASHTHENCIITPNQFIKTIIKQDEIWGYRQQQDSQEFLSFLLNKIEEEVAINIDIIQEISENKIIDLANNTWNNFLKKEFSIIKTLFGGMYHNIIICEFCGNESHNFDIFQILQLPINGDSLYDSLDSFIKTEQLDEDNKLLCEKCNKQNQSNKHNLFWSVPKVLVIQFKRFKTNEYGQITSKNNSYIEYPTENFDMFKYIDNESPYKKHYNYKLYAVNSHIGFIHGGHYTTTALNQYNKKWYIFNDSDPLIETTDLVNKNAYMLFYYMDN
jgi:ubiquitin C-terminal hydrolase